MTDSAQGQDRSSWQGDGPWNGLGLTFGSVKATEGTWFTDPSFTHNWEAMRHAGLHRFAYHFFHPGVDPAAQARFFTDTVKTQGILPGDGMIADIEITAGLDGRAVTSAHAAGRSHLVTRLPDGSVQPLAGVREAALLRYAGAGPGPAARVFLDEVRRLCKGLGTVEIVYTDLSVGAQLTLCDCFPLWIAWPGDVPPETVQPWARWRFWQYAFTGGWNGSDLDAYNGTAGDLQAWLDGYAAHAAKPAEAPDVSA